MAKCNIPDTNPLNKPCNVTVTPTVPVNSSCTPSNTNPGISCPKVEDCSPFRLTEFADSCLIDNYIAEQLRIAGAMINVFKLLGIHEQGKLMDLTGMGSPISSGDIPNFPAENAFDKFISEWRSNKLGSDVLTSFIGYDFGEIKLSNGRNRYGLDTFVRHDVATIKIMQGCDSKNRISKARIERSDDGKKWYGVTVVDIPDCDGLATINFNKSVPSRFWRLRPTKFNGGANDWWAIRSLQLIDYEATSLSNIQDRIFMENRDRDYLDTSIQIKGSYTPLETQTFQSKFGNSQIFAGTDTYSIEVSFSDVIAKLGRPLVIGDVIQLPSETQFTPTLKPVLKYLEITDISWATGGFTPNWKPTLQKVIAEPIMASQEMQDILGKLTEDIDTSGLVDINNGDNTKTYQDISAITQTIQANANSLVPENGEDYGEVTKLSDEAIKWGKDRNINMTKIDRTRNFYGIDALPPNGLPYTEGDKLPDVSTAKNGDFHRLTYSFINNAVPARLYKFSKAKNRWIYQETDRRFEFKDGKSLQQQFLNPESGSVTNPRKTDKI